MTLSSILTCGECRHWYNDDGNFFGVCLFDQVERLANCKCVHPGWIDPVKLDNDDYIPKECAGCKHLGFRIPMPSMFPCNFCKRAYQDDYYEVVK